MLVLNFNLYLVPLGVLLAFLKQYVIHVLLTERNVNPEDQVGLNTSMFWALGGVINLC